MNTSIVAIYPSHMAAERAVKELQQSGFDMKKLSIVGRDFHSDEHVIGYYNTGDRMMKWGGIGAFWGWIWACLFGSAFFFVPGVGPLLVAGPLVVWIVGALESAALVGGLSAIGAALVGIGIPKDSILRYEKALKADNFVVVAHGSADEIAQAKDILSAAMPSALEQHEGSSRGHPTTTQINIEVGGRNTSFVMDWERHRWQSLNKQEESAFPVATVLDGQRYELYSDETFSEVEK